MNPDGCCSNLKQYFHLHFLNSPFTAVWITAIKFILRWELEIFQFREMLSNSKLTLKDRTHNYLRKTFIWKMRPCDFPNAIECYQTLTLTNLRIICTFSSHIFISCYILPHFCGLLTPLHAASKGQEFEQLWESANRSPNISMSNISALFLYEGSKGCSRDIPKDCQFERQLFQIGFIA